MMIATAPVTGRAKDKNQSPSVAMFIYARYRAIAAKLTGTKMAGLYFLNQPGRMKMI